MKALQRILIAAIAVALLVPMVGAAGQMPAPLDKKVPAGVTTLSYAGQNLRFSTPIALKVRLEPMDPDVRQIKIVVSVYPGTPSGSSSAGFVDIYWENFGSDVYNGPPPSSEEPFEGVMNTESGFTEK